MRNMFDCHLAERSSRVSATAHQNIGNANFALEHAQPARHKSGSAMEQKQREVHSFTRAIEVLLLLVCIRCVSLSPLFNPNTKCYTSGFHEASKTPGAAGE